jgi:hypothetical protein
MAGDVTHVCLFPPALFVSPIVLCPPRSMGPNGLCASTLKLPAGGHRVGQFGGLIRGQGQAASQFRLDSAELLERHPFRYFGKGAAAKSESLSFPTRSHVVLFYFVWIPGTSATSGLGNERQSDGTAATIAAWPSDRRSTHSDTFGIGGTPWREAKEFAHTRPHVRSHRDQAVLAGIPASACELA